MKKIFFILILIFASILSFSQSLLWKVSGNKLKKASYLYGSIHIQDKRVFAFDETVTNAFNSSESFAMEILLDKIPDEELKNSTFMKDNTLDKLLTKEQFKTVDSIVKAMTGTSALMFNKMKPFFLSSLLSQLSIPKDMPTALDQYFLEEARKQGKPCYEVEKFSDQINAINSISEAEQAQMLYESLTDTAIIMEEEFDKLINAYLAFDLDKLMKITKEDDAYSENFEKVFITERNKTMAKNFIKIIQKQDCFCVVGAAHIAGESGVIELLRKAGYTVEPVIFEWVK
jgi:uncharacterized protein YbaP (TraB family)